MVIFKFFKKDSNEKKVVEKKVDSKETSLEAPKEVPSLAMEEYPLDDSLVTFESVKAEIINKQPSELPSLKLSDVKIEKKIQSDSDLLKPQESLVTKQDSMNQELYKSKKEIVLPDLTPKQETQTSKPIISTEPILTNQPIKNQDSKKEVTFDDVNDEVVQKRDLFFTSLKNQLDKRSNEKVSLNQKELLENMKNYQQNIMAKEVMLKEKQKIDVELADKIMTLEFLEESWYMLKREIESKQMLLIQKEKLIDEVVLELKLLMEKDRNSEKNIKNIQPNHWFTLKDGRKISSISELKETLKTIEDHVFFHHVNELKNDFSSWIRHVFLDAELADKIVSAKTKEELINVLEKN